ncbi:hypothetical protein [Gordonia hydrophobica]|uniref:Uncharacterized protein n=1 Tax=Gordonia hydrophobica TaxID=40516 RepID=A0ABZ2TYT6_9ACTN|nr:hypothetical protein [Gordonia hydrophobica]MBM7367080.1 hypothetical protein [Gordonia hydrophobica]
MKIDCGRCPVRARACDDCMMQVFFPAATSGYSGDSALSADEAELVDAIGVFVDTELVCLADADAARLHVTAGDGNFAGKWTGGLRAV